MPGLNRMGSGSVSRNPSRAAAEWARILPPSTQTVLGPGRGPKPPLGRSDADRSPSQSQNSSPSDRSRRRQSSTSPPDSDTQFFASFYEASQRAQKRKAAGHATVTVTASSSPMSTFAWCVMPLISLSRCI